MNPEVVPATPQPILIRFYTKADCPLCDEAALLLEAASHHWSLDLRPVSILQSPALYERFWNRIPVLEFGDGSTVEPPITRGRLVAELRRQQTRD